MKLIFACFVVLLMSFLSVHADLNGVWIDAKDIRTGTFGSDESGGDYVFPNNLDVSDRLTTNRIVSTTANITSFLEANTINVDGNAGSLKLIGEDHTYLEFYPQGSSTRKGWIGFGTAGSEVLSIQSEGDNLVLNPNGNYVGIGVSNPLRKLDVNGSAYIRGGVSVSDGVYADELYEGLQRVATRWYVDSKTSGKRGLYDRGPGSKEDGLWHSVDCSGKVTYGLEIYAASHFDGEVGIYCQDLPGYLYAYSWTSSTDRYLDNTDHVRKCDVDEGEVMVGFSSYATDHLENLRIRCAKTSFSLGSGFFTTPSSGSNGADNTFHRSQCPEGYIAYGVKAWASSKLDGELQLYCVEI